MKLVLIEFLSLDGVSQGPGSPDEDTSDGFGRGGWFVPHIDESFLQQVAGWVDQADAFLFGSRTYRNFARDWPTMANPNDSVATALNGLPKYVASNSLTSADWAPSTVLRGDTVREVASLKSRSGRELQIHGSARLAQSLLHAGLIDELRLAVAPVVVGHGRKLFSDGGEPQGFTLLTTQPTARGLIVQTYAKGGAAHFATYVHRS